MRELPADHTALAERIEKAGAYAESSILVAIVQGIQKLKNPQMTRAIGFPIPPSPNRK